MPGILNISLPLRAGKNILRVIAVAGGLVPDCTPSGSISAGQVYLGKAQFDATLKIGSSYTYSLGFPQAIISASKYPESAKHIKDAQGLGFPKLVTLDRPNATKRREATKKHYLDNGGTPATPGVQDLDGYPQAIFLENGGKTHVRPIDLHDNRGSGSTLRYLIAPLKDGNNCEVVAGP